MVDFSLEASSKRIYISKSKEYFKEVLSSYLNSNYRATIVTLYSVFICDVVFKLQQLRDLYNNVFNVSLKWTIIR